MNHVVLIDWEQEGDNPYEALLSQVIAAALEAEGVRTPCELNVVLTGDEGIRQINREQRQVDKPTDVLSFPMFDYIPGHPPVDDADADPATGLTPLGDMVLSLERAKEQAAEYGHSLQRELAYLTVHSVLHLLGYDHLDEGEQKAHMRTREEAVLESLNLTRR